MMIWQYRKHRKRVQFCQQRNGGQVGLPQRIRGAGKRMKAFHRPRPEGNATCKKAASYTEEHQHDCYGRSKKGQGVDATD